MTREELREKITDILIKHSITDCPNCNVAINCPDLDTEEALLDLIDEYSQVVCFAGGQDDTT